MHPDEINTYKRARPFRPFRLVLVDGESFVVPSPENVLATEPMVFVGTDYDASGFPENVRAFSPESVVKVEVLPALDKAS
jgi:hypothetical protein